MVPELKLNEIGNSTGPQPADEVLNKQHVEAVSSVTATEGAPGFQMTAGDPELTQAMRVFGDLAGRYQNTLAELAK